jgi:DNA uptake protein ComE-like DNA-binding protein
MRVLSLLGAVGVGMFGAAWLAAGKRRAIFGRTAININQASPEELMQGLGIDAETAERIVEHRPYPSKIDLLGRMVLPEETYRTIKNRISYKTA